MARYAITVCDEEQCGIVGYSTSAEKAEAKMARELKKRSKKLRKAKVPRGSVRGEVRELERGIPAAKPLYVGHEYYGDGERPTRRRRAERPAE